jgi:hypothetical protein
MRAARVGHLDRPGDYTHDGRMRFAYTYVCLRDAFLQKTLPLIDIAAMVNLNRPSYPVTSLQ